MEADKNIRKLQNDLHDYLVSEAQEDLQEIDRWIFDSLILCMDKNSYTYKAIIAMDKKRFKWKPIQLF